VIISTQKLAGSQKGFRRGWQAGTVQGMILAIALATPASHHDDDAAPYTPFGSPSFPASPL